MARMLPPVVSETTVSAAERQLFDKIRRDLSDDWTVLHSLGLATHARKPWAEIDFVLVGPAGVYCIEAKGGRVVREEGVWTTKSRDGSVYRLKESPFKQAGGASSALYQFLREQLPALAKVVTGFGVALPDVRFTALGLDIIPDAVFDERDLSFSFQRYVDRLSQYWMKDITSRTGREPVTLDKASVRRVVDILCADFDLRPSLAMRISAHGDHPFRPMAITHFGPSRSAISVHGDHLFRSMAITALS